MTTNRQKRLARLNPDLPLVYDGKDIYWQDADALIRVLGDADRCFEAGGKVRVEVSPAIPADFDGVLNFGTGEGEASMPRQSA